MRELEVSELPFPAAAAVRLARLRASTALRMPDWGVLLAAEDAAATLASLDDRLARVAGERGLPVLGR